MIVKCQQCQKEINIPDEKVKNVQRFVVKCPSCSARILVDKNKLSSNSAFEQEPAPPQDGARLDYAPDNVPLGKKLALLFLENKALSKELSAYLQSKEFVCREVKDVEEALGRLLVNNYDFIVLEDSKEGAQVLTELNTWPLKQRRRVCVILLIEKGEDFDQRLAFEKSVNFCLCPGANFLLKVDQCLREYNSYLQYWE